MSTVTVRSALVEEFYNKNHSKSDGKFTSGKSGGTENYNNSGSRATSMPISGMKLAKGTDKYGRKIEEPASGKSKAMTQTRPIRTVKTGGSTPEKTAAQLADHKRMEASFTRPADRTPEQKAILKADSVEWKQRAVDRAKTDTKVGRQVAGMGRIKPTEVTVSSTGQIKVRGKEIDAELYQGYRNGRGTPVWKLKKPLVDGPSSSWKTKAAARASIARSLSSLAS